MSEQITFDLFVPDRFEPLQERAKSELSTIIEPVFEGLNKIDAIFGDLVSAGRGGFLVLRGDSGTGKSTFIHTVNLFREGVESYSIDGSTDVKTYLKSVEKYSGKLRIIVLEEREALKDIPETEIEKDLHAINGFLRSRNGSRTLVVWPCNTDNLQQKVLLLARQIGAEALLGIDGGAFTFSGPRKDQFRKIAEKTVATLNQGASLSDLGISEDELASMVDTSDTVGRLLGQLRNAMNSKKGSVSSLLKKEQCKLWIVVSAGNEPVGDVAALTRGRYSAIDIERMLTATEANIVRELKSFPDKLGILATVLDARIFHLPMLATLEIARTYADDGLRAKMKALKLSDKGTSPDKIFDRLSKTDFGKAFDAGHQGLLGRGGKAGSNTKEAFDKLVSIAQNDDVSLNRALGSALKEAQYVRTFKPEQDFGSGLTRRTDLYCETETEGIVRLELMWRVRASRADIANYALTKLYNYGRAIGFLS